MRQLTSYIELLSYVNSMTSPLFHPNFEGIPFGPDRPRWGQCEQVPRLFGREIILYIFQPMWSRYLNVSDRRTDRQTDGQTTWPRAIKKTNHKIDEKAGTNVTLRCNVVTFIYLSSLSFGARCQGGHWSLLVTSSYLSDLTCTGAAGHKNGMVL